MGNEIKLKNSKQNYKQSRIKRLVRESLILSCLNRISMRVVGVLKKGIMSTVFCGADYSDKLLKQGMIGHIASKIDLRSLKMYISSGIEKSGIVYIYRRLITALLSASLRFYGILISTYGIYGIGIYTAKIYSLISNASFNPSINDLYWSALFVITGFPMLFTGKSVFCVLRTSKIFRWLFIGVLGINEMVLEERKKPETFGTAAFVLGTALGITTIVVKPSIVIGILFMAVLVSCILYSPEFGMLASIMLFPIISVKLLASLLFITVVCYLLKVLRAKRNLSFKTTDIFILCFGLFIVSAGLFSGSGGHIRALYLLCFLSIYFLIGNLVVTEKLIRQALYSICIGAAVSCFLFILDYISQNSIQDELINTFLSNTDIALFGKASFGYYLIMLLPICLALFKSNINRSERASLLVLTVINALCIFISYGNFFITAAYIAVFIYALFSNKNPALTVLVFSLITFVLSVIIPHIPFLSGLYYTNVLNFSENNVSTLINRFILTGVGIGDNTIISGLNELGVSNNIVSIGIFERFIVEGGLFYLITFLFVIIFILQKAFYCVIKITNKRVDIISAAFISGILTFLLLGLFYNVWEDIRIYMLFWIICGMITALKNVYGRNTTEEALN